MAYYEILLPLALLLIVSKVLMKLCSKVGIPSVVGMLLAGVVVGFLQYIPSQTILSDTALTGLGFISKIGVILIMFSAGIETDLGQIKKVGGPAVLITAAGVIFPMALGFVVSVLCHGGFAALTTETALKSVFYGTILTATSVSVTVATLRESGKLNTKVGTSIVASAIIDDILGIVVLSFVLSLSGGDGGSNPWIVLLKTVLYFVVIMVLSVIAKRFFDGLDKRFPHHRLVPIFSLAFCFAVAYCSERFFGIADITGAYVVGLILSTNPDRKYIDRKSDVLSYMFFVPVFFGNIGISTQFSGIGGEMLLFGFLFIAAGIVGKLCGCGAAALTCGYGFSDSLKVGLGMMARAEVALVTAQKGIEHGIIDSSIMPFIVIMIILTSFITPICLQASYRSDERKLEQK
ncbi:MAG: cation:proton antiporter [Clostridiales bacterium]|nr:cation:proton antiporter [Clostridiales bacterium]